MLDDPLWLAVIILHLVALVALLGVWVTIDAARRGRSWVGWMWATAFLGGFAVLAWLVVRRRSPVDPTITRPTTTQLWAVALPVFALMSVACPSVRTSYVQVARVEGQSMSPTLRDQDRLVINKAIYDLRVPRRGELVMLRYPLNPDQLFIMRVIGEPADLIEIRSGRVWLNGVPLEEPYVPAEHRSLESWGPTTIDEAHYFVMGDRRNNSSDSRQWGQVPRKYIVGRVAYRWFPFGEWRSDWGGPSLVDPQPRIAAL